MTDDVMAWFPFLRESNPNAVMMGDDYPGACSMKRGWA